MTRPAPAPLRPGQDIPQFHGSTARKERAGGQRGTGGSARFIRRESRATGTVRGRELFKLIWSGASTADFLPARSSAFGLLPGFSRHA